MNPKVDWFFDKETKWQKEFEKLRMTILDCGLDEELNGATLVTHSREGTLF